MTPPDVAILGPRGEGWHGLRLRRALAEAGLSAGRVAFDACALRAGAEGPAIRLGDLDGLPRAVLVRAMPSGTFEQVTFRLGVLHALAASSVLVTNDPRAIERCIDKSAASFFLARAGVPTPPTWCVERPEAARAILRRQAALGHALVLKPLFGAQGKGLRLLHREDELPPADETAGVHYLQRFVGRTAGETWCDFRVLVIGGDAVAAMARRGRHWITNVGQGGVPEAVPARGRLAELATAAAMALGADHAGVDLIEDTTGGLQVLEVNSMPAWRGLQSVCETDIARHLAADIARRLADRSGGRA